ncbi:glycerophosphocholine phosphodiesterase GPCPD1 isoform X1 [Centruroides vittatus]|uniref:glycerophosphocholine phosphodiesterase GPCPD1 isoform X1 n=1 Tax=Centruroides vittatus TaxID=120091 RepID=UPI00350F5A23
MNIADNLGVSPADIPPESLIKVNVKVQCHVASNETVCITGNIKELGKWKVKNCITMAEDPEQSGTWNATILVAPHRKVYFRYFVAIILKSDDGRKIFIRNWESHLHPRKLNIENNELHIFGMHNDGNVKIDQGWLTEQTVLQFNLYNKPITIWENQYRRKPIFFHLSALDKSISSINFTRPPELDLQNINEEEPPTWPVVEIAIMSDEDCKFKMQNQFGHQYNPDEFVLFRIHMLYPRTIVYKIDFYCQTEDYREYIGFCIILSESLQGTTGSHIVPINGKSERPIGQLTFSYLFIQPLQSYTCDFSITYATHWKHGFTQLDVGHRGAGKVRRTDTSDSVLENTVASFNYAAKHGADMVELDVQLTKDKIPIVYHDYYICLSPKSKKESSTTELLEVAVKDLTEKQLKRLKLNPATGDTNLFRDDDYEDNQPFPTLEYCLKAVVPEASFNIEIKSPMQLRDGTWELDQRFELNDYLDKILTIILKYAGTRYIILSCFDPDICSMIRMKQNKYPLLFLTQGVTEKYPAYLDLRTSSVPMAAFFALSIGILGIDVHAEEILKNRSLISFVKSKNLVLFIWGDDVNCSHLINNLKEEGVDGIIYDKVDELSSKVKKAVYVIDPTFQSSILNDIELAEVTGAD